MDSDGDARQDSVFITVWKQWDFTWGGQPRARAGLAGRRVEPAPAPFKRHGGQHPVVPSARSTGNTPGLVVLYRPMRKALPVHGPAGVGAMKMAQTPAAQRACQQAWRGVLDYVRKGTAQARAHHPLWAACMKKSPRAPHGPHVHALFTERYNDWWDSEKRPVGRPVLDGRTPALPAPGRALGPRFQAELENGDDGPGDAPDNAHSAYQIDIEEAREGPPLLRVAYSQRQSEPRTPIPPDAADHLARLLRLYRQAQTHIERLTAAMAHEAQPPQPPLRNCSPCRRWRQYSRYRRFRRRVDAALSPVASHRPGLRTASPRPTRRCRRSTCAGHGAGSGRMQTFAVWRCGRRHASAGRPRAADAEAVLQLAREVHRHADMGLAARFRQRFAFAPMRWRPMPTGRANPQALAAAGR